MLAGVVEVLSTVMILCGAAGALIATSAWLSERKFPGDSYGRRSTDSTGSTNKDGRR